MIKKNNSFDCFIDNFLNFYWVKGVRLLVFCIWWIWRRLVACSSLIGCMLGGRRRKLFLLGWEIVRYYLKKWGIWRILLGFQSLILFLKFQILYRIFFNGLQNLKNKLVLWIHRVFFPGFYKNLQIFFGFFPLLVYIFYQNLDNCCWDCCIRIYMIDLVKNLYLLPPQVN